MNSTQEIDNGTSGVTTPCVPLSAAEAPIVRIPIVIGRNRLRGNGQGAMVEDVDGENLAALRSALRDEARIAGVEATPEWLTTSVSQVLRLAYEAREEWRAAKNDTVGFVFEAACPSGRSLLFSEAPTLARFGASIEQKVREAREVAH